jgi:hypothetical protein
MIETRDTIGKLSSELIVKPLESESSYEQMTEQLSDYDKNIFERLILAKSKYPGDFYVVVITKKEPLMKNVIRSYFLDTRDCPTPTWDQVVYAYTKSDDKLEFLWVVPDKATCEAFYLNRTMVKPDELELLKFILDFKDGTLLRLAKKRNGEIETPPVILLDNI